MQAHRAKETDGMGWAIVRRGWCLRDEQFRVEMLECVVCFDPARLHNGWHGYLVVYVVNDAKNAVMRPTILIVVPVLPRLS